MSDQRKHGIAWTDATWNPIRGCSMVSAGCTNCYAMRQAARFTGAGQPYEGLAVVTPSGPRWTGEVRLVPERLADPLRWRKPRRIFVNSMSDLFHEKLTYDDIARIFDVMRRAQWHTYQVLTKRARRMREFVGWLLSVGKLSRWPELAAAWPMPQVHLGVSVEDQPSADERIPELLATPAAIRWISLEPQLEAVDLSRFLGQIGELGAWTGFGARLDWVVQGGESGPKARPFDLEWARSVMLQCRSAGVAVFLKQAGRRPVLDGHSLLLKDRKGGDLSELSLDLRVREYPQ